MKKRVLKLLATLMALALLCGALPFTVRAADWPPADAVPLTLNADPASVSIPAGSTTRYCVFTPSESAVYIFKCTDSSANDAFLYDAGGNQLAASDRREWVPQPLRVAYRMTAGATYYFKVTCSEYYYNTEVSVQAVLWNWPDPEYLAFTAGETAAYVFIF